MRRLLLLLLLLSSSCDGCLEPATAGAPCDSDDDCAAGLECAFVDGDGFCAPPRPAEGEGEGEEGEGEEGEGEVDAIACSSSVDLPEVFACTLKACAVDDDIVLATDEPDEAGIGPVVLWRVRADGSRVGPVVVADGTAEAIAFDPRARAVLVAFRGDDDDLHFAVHDADTLAAVGTPSVVSFARASFVDIAVNPATGVRATAWVEGGRAVVSLGERPTQAGALEIATDEPGFIGSDLVWSDDAGSFVVFSKINARVLDDGGVEPLSGDAGGDFIIGSRTAREGGFATARLLEVDGTALQVVVTDGGLDQTGRFSDFDALPANRANTLHIVGDGRFAVIAALGDVQHLQSIVVDEAGALGPIDDISYGDENFQGISQQSCSAFVALPQGLFVLHPNATPEGVGPDHLTLTRVCPERP